MNDLRKKAIKLAYENPKLRAKLLPLIQASARSDEKRRTAGPQLYEALRTLINVIPDESTYMDPSQKRQIDDKVEKGLRVLKDADRDKTAAGPQLYGALRSLMLALPDDDEQIWEDSSQARQIEDKVENGIRALKDAGGDLHKP